MQKVELEPFEVIGIAVRTTNVDGQSAQDIGQLWGKFMSEGILAKIPNRVDDTIYCIYTDYEGDYMQPYTTILACKVHTTDIVPEGMLVKRIQGESYAQFIAKGDLEQGLVYQTWLDIWKTDLDRRYGTDYEIYGEKTQNRNAAEVEILVGVV